MGDFLDEEGDLPVLPPPITAAEIAAMRASFHWDEASPLSETNSNGQPALHYAVILIPDTEAEEALKLMGIHFDGMPLFEEELESYQGKLGMVDLPSDGAAAAVFSILPAGVFNILREEALEGNVLFPGIILRDAPVANAMLPDGSLSYEYLVERGFTYGQSMDVILDPSLEIPVGVGLGLAATSLLDVDGDPRLERKRKLRNFFRKGILRRIVKAVVNVVKAVVQAVRVVASQVRQVFAGSRTISLSVKVGNVVSSQFDSPSGEMLRAWGKDGGKPLKLSRVTAHFTSRFALERRDLDDNGFVKVTVPRGKRYGIAIPLNHKAVRITSGAGIYEKRLVLYSVTDKAHYGRLSDDSRSEPIEVEVKGLRDRYVNVFLQMQDSAAYVRRIMGVEPMKVIVNVPSTDRSKGQDGALLGRARASCGSILSEYPIFSGATLFSQVATQFWAEWDINMHGASGLSRETPTHEYGHWVMCQMMREYAYPQLPWIMDRIMVRSSVESFKKEEVHLAEGWADFFASQVAGGVDYFSMNAASGEHVVARLPEWSVWTSGWFCNEARIAGTGGIACLEDNVGAAFYHSQSHLGGTPDELKAREVTLLTDAVDGHSLTEFRDQPGNGTNWSFNAGATRATVVRGADEEDEEIVLGGADLRKFWKNWGDIRGYKYQFEDVHLALATTMRKAGYARDEICELFALHTPSGDCADLVALDEVFDGPSASRPIGVSAVLLRPNTRGEASAVRVSFTDPVGIADGYVVRASIGGSLYEEKTGAASRDNSVVFTELPFDEHIEFEVRFTKGGEVSGAVRPSLTTEAEPVPEIGDQGPFWGAIVHWEATKASYYVVFVEDQNGIVHRSDPIATTSFNVLPFVPQDSPYKAWVAPLNRDGEEASFVSDEHEGVAWFYTGPG